MKIPVNHIAALIIIALFVSGCEKDETKQLNLSGKLIDHTDCKNGRKAVNETPDTLSCINYSFDSQNNKLSIQHINAGFNCCPDSLYCTAGISNDTITISEFEAKAGCWCECLYDLDVELNGVGSGKYVIRLVEPHSGNQSKIIFSIDLSKNISGSFCVTRKIYPWGQ